MILDFEQDDLPAGKSFDVCIAGAGAAGLALAYQLVRRGRSVLLLEGGGKTRWERRSQALNKSHILGQTFNGAHSGRFRGLGGSTMAWGGFVMELDDIDFQPRDWVEGSSWPISKSDLKKFYVQAREIEATDNLVHDNDDLVWERARTPAPSLGDQMRLFFCHRVPEKNFARRFADTLENERLTVLLHANAVEMVPSDDKQRIAALRFRTVAGKEACCSAKQIALCLGGIESNRFLLNQRFAPWNEHSLVGRHFQDHIHCLAADVSPTDLGRPNWPYGRFYNPKFSMTPKVQQQYRSLNVTGLVKYADGVFDTLKTGIKVVTGPASAIGVKEFIRMTPRLPSTLWFLYKMRQNPDYVAPWAKLKLSVSSEQSPLSTSSITLSDKRDKLGLFKADINWRISEQEIDSIRTFVTLTKQSFEANGIAEVTPDPDLYTDKITEKFEDTFHHCGGTRMAVRRQDGVVDPDLRLNGVENAYVCSASVFPTSGIANPTHTIVALAARLAEHLDSKLAGQRNAYAVSAAV